MKACTPCRGGIPPLTAEQVLGYLAQAPDWALLDDKPEDPAHLSVRELSRGARLRAAGMLEHALIRERFRSLSPHLDESGRRLLAAAEAPMPGPEGRRGLRPVPGEAPGQPAILDSTW